MELNGYSTPCSACVGRTMKCKKQTKGRAGCKPCNQFHTECNTIEESVNIVGGTGGERAASVVLADATLAETSPVATAEPAPKEATAAVDTGLQPAAVKEAVLVEDKKIMPWLCDMDVEAEESAAQEPAAMDIVEQLLDSSRVIDLVRLESLVVAVVNVVAEGSRKVTEQENPW
jgi:hypothetical protein